MATFTSLKAQRTSMSRWKALLIAGRRPRFLTPGCGGRRDGLPPRCGGRLCPELVGVCGSSAHGAAGRGLPAFWKVWHPARRVECTADAVSCIGAHPTLPFCRTTRCVGHVNAGSQQQLVHLTVWSARCSTAAAPAAAPGPPGAAQSVQHCLHNRGVLYFSIRQ